MTAATKKPAKRTRAPLLAKALESASMSTTTEDLLTGATSAPPAGELQHLELAVIFPAADNPRSNLGDLTGLAASIAAVGVLEPILVRVSPVVSMASPKYQIVAGHRRYAAAKLAGLETIPCLVRTFTEQARVEAMVIENLQRSDLSPFDEARGLTQLVAVGLSQRDIAKRVGCSQSHVSKRLSLAALPAAAEKLFVDERLSVRAIEELAKVKEEDVDGVVEGLVKHAENVKTTTLLPEWAINESIDRLKKARKHDEAEKVGVASGLKRLNDRPYDSPGGTHRVCGKKDATHWYLGDRDASLVWARTQAAHNKANPTPVREPSVWELERQARDHIDNFIGDRILPDAMVGPAARAVFIASVSTIARDYLRLAWIRAVSLTEEIDTLIGDDNELYIAVAMLCGLVAERWKQPVLDLFIAHGYRTTGVGETFPDGFDPTPILITDPVEPVPEPAAS